MLEDDPEGNQEGAHDVGPDEYMDTDYEFEETDDDMEEEQDSGKDHPTSSVSEAQPDHSAPPVNPAREYLSPEA